MGHTPDQIRAMSHAEYLLLAEGFEDLKRREAGNEDTGADDHPTLDEVYDLMALHPDT